MQRSTESLGQLGVIWPDMIDQDSFAVPSAVSHNSLINTLVEADCLEVLAQVPDASVNLILCDLPFGTTQNRWDSVIPLERLWAHYRRVLAPRGAVVLNSQGAFTARLILSNEEWFRYKLAWVKSKPTGFLNAKRQPLRKHEDVCVFYPRPPKYFPQMTVGTAYSKGIRKDQHTGSYGEFKPILVASDGARYPTDAIYFKTAESEGPVWHPTQKPVALGRYLVRTFSEVGDLVLDNAFGSGSYLVAALLEGRNFIGIEMNQDVNRFKSHPVDYIAVAESRLAQAYGEMDPDARRHVRWPLKTIRAAT